MKSKLSSIFNNNKFSVVFSLIVAFVFWFVLSVDNTAQVSVTKKIAVSWDASIQSMQQNYENFDVITVNGQKLSEFSNVSVTVVGAPSSVSSITDSDIAIIPDLTGFLEPGTQSVNLNAQIINNAFNSCSVSNISPSTVKVRVDQYVEKAEFDVQAQYENLSLKSGMESNFVLGTAVLKNAENKIQISGPKTEIDSITSVVCVADFEDQEVDTAVEQTGKIVLYDANNNVVDPTYLELSYSQADITVPIFSKKTVSITPSFVNAPSSFSGKVSLSVTSATIRGSSDVIDTLDSISTKDIDFTQLVPGKVNTYMVELNVPAGVSLMDEIFAAGSTTVEVTIDATSLATTTVSATNISFLNLASGLKARLLQPSVNVKLVGSQEEIDEVQDSDLLITADLSGKNAATNVEMPLTITVQGYRTVFVIYESGSVYTAEIEITK